MDKLKVVKDICKIMNKLDLVKIYVNMMNKLDVVKNTGGRTGRTDGPGGRTGRTDRADGPGGRTGRKDRADGRKPPPLHTPKIRKNGAGPSRSLSWSFQKLDLPGHCHCPSKNWTFPVTVMVLLKTRPPRSLSWFF